MNKTQYSLVPDLINICINDHYILIGVIGTISGCNTSRRFAPQGLNDQVKWSGVG
jgi:hypothetical protein